MAGASASQLSQSLSNFRASGEKLLETDGAAASAGLAEWVGGCHWVPEGGGQTGTGRGRVGRRAGPGLVGGKREGWIRTWGTTLKSLWRFREQNTYEFYISEGSKKLREGLEKMVHFGGKKKNL